MNKLIFGMKHLSLLLFVLFMFIGFYFSINVHDMKIGMQAFIWASAYAVMAFIFSVILRKDLLKIHQPLYKIVIVYNNMDAMNDMLEEMIEGNGVNELKEVLFEPNNDTFDIMYDKDFQKINPKMDLQSFPCYLVVNGERLVTNKTLLQKPLYSSTSIKNVHEFLRANQKK